MLDSQQYLATHYMKNIFYILCVVSTDSQRLWLLFSGYGYKQIELTLKNLNENNLTLLATAFRGLICCGSGGGGGGTQKLVPPKPTLRYTSHNEIWYRHKSGNWSLHANF